MKKINILGTQYTIEVHKASEDALLKENKWSGYHNGYSKLIVIADLDEKEFYPNVQEADKDAIAKHVLRHEITHAFLFESGLDSDSFIVDDPWATSEELVDWIAHQLPKMVEVFKELNCL